MLCYISYSRDEQFSSKFFKETFLGLKIIAFDEGERFLISWSPVNASESSEGFLGFLSGGQL